MYTWGRAGGGERYIMYLWQGKDCPVNDSGASAGIAMEINKALCGGGADTVRCSQYHEPAHLLLAFQGLFTVTSTKLLTDSNLENNERMYHCRGTEFNNTRTLHVPMGSARLNSNDAFVIVRQSNVYLVSVSTLIIIIIEFMQMC